MADTLSIEVVFALPNRQKLVELRLPQGATIADAVSASGLEQVFQDVNFAKCEVGIWGKPQPRSYLLRDNDRVEVYRPLDMDPREARRQLALVGQTMGKVSPD